MSRALGRYELLRPLARGGMAEVFLARRRAAGVEKWLVVKRIRPERAGDARFLDLFVREARLSMSLAHQNIVPVFDFGRIDDQVFIAMERVEGRDLGSSLARAGKPLPPMLAAWVAAECLQALDYAHHRKSPEGTALGIVHRDVTPRNVLLSWSGEVKLTDFGIAALAGEDASAYKMIGTPAYMAPEQARGEPLDPRADLYAVGLVLREALTGVRARPGDDREAIVAAARRAELLPWPDGFASPLRAICERATAPDRADRYADAREMLEALDELIVAERAGNKEERRAPARLLAAWLEDAWGSQRAQDDAATSGEIDGEHLVSFMDDGELGIIGTGTVRSMAATASEVVERPAAETPSPAPAPAPAAPPKRRLGWWLAGAAVAIGGAAVAATMALGGSSTSTTTSPVAVVPPPSPSPSPSPPPPPPPSPSPSPPPNSRAQSFRYATTPRESTLPLAAFSPAA
ncbi:MAG: serine/threonine-protein kinase, partial [Acidobacteriota bacterium]